MAVNFNGTNYYYLVNLQGDVMGIVDSTGNIVVSYTYDAWGKPLSTTGMMASTLGTLNPLRYRGYVYDTETGLYYLQSRYYNPEIGRFINADGFTSTGQGFVGNTMFVYCLNNPIKCVDPTGNWAIDISELFKSFFKRLRDFVADLVATVMYAMPIPEGGETVYQGQVRICTDGSDGTLVEDDYWYPDTALTHNGESLDAYNVCYVVVPLNVYYSDKDILGSSALVINHDTGMRVWCVVGDQGPSKNGWGEVSIAAIWDTGNRNHMTANTAYGLGSNYEIILYRERKYDFIN